MMILYKIFIFVDSDYILNIVTIMQGLSIAS